MSDSVLFGRYRLLERAGSGGSAEVWRARDERTGDEVAVKRLHPIVVASESGRRRLVREFRALRQLAHPNIVRVRDLEMGTDDAALILDYVPGESLAGRLARDRVLPEAEALAIARDVAAGLAAAHAGGVVHRDVTPGNVLLGRTGPARLTDFGIAVDGADETAVTGTGQLVGTLRFLAPEQLRGEPATPKSDLFSLAAVTYEMLAGMPAFAATTPVALVESHARGAAPIPGIDPHLDQTVRRALSADPDDRPASVTAFAAALTPAAAAAVTEVVALPFGTGALGVAAGAAGLTGASGLSGAAGLSGATGTSMGERGRERTTRGPRTHAGRAGRRLSPAPVAAVAALAFGGLVLAALAPNDPAAGAPPAAAEPSLPTARPTPPPTPAPTQAAPVADPADAPPAGDQKDGDKDDDPRKGEDQDENKDQDEQKGEGDKGEGDKGEGDKGEGREGDKGHGGG